MSYLRPLYELLPKDAQRVAKKGYNSITEVELRTISYLLDAGIISTLDRSDLKPHPEIKYYAYDEAEKRIFSVPAVSEKERLIKTTIEKRVDGLEDFITSYDLENNEYNMTCHEPFVAELSDVNIFGPHALAVTADRELPIEVKANLRRNFVSMLRSTLRWYGRSNTVKQIARINKPNQHFEIATSLLTGRKNSVPAYGHWLVEILPRIRGIKHYQRKTGREPTILINTNTTDWQLDLLELAGVDEKNVERWDGSQALINRYILPMWPKNHFHSSNFNWIEEKIKRNVNYEKYENSFSSRVYISRENMNRRQVLNREQLVDSISGYGFESYSPETMTFAEQVALYKNADILMGAKGSGLANMIFSNDSNVIELFPSNYFHLWQFEVSKISNNRYYPIFGDRIDASRKTNHQDCYIPPHRVKRLLDMIV
jgi:hypothetical protein